VDHGEEVFKAMTDFSNEKATSAASITAIFADLDECQLALTNDGLGRASAPQEPDNASRAGAGVIDLAEESVHEN
jgi:hypothetical protein